MEFCKRAGKDATEFKGVAARANYLSLDCPDLQFPVKECSREMASPTRNSWAKAKKVARYLVGRRRVVWEFAWQQETEEAKNNHSTLEQGYLRLNST